MERKTILNRQLPKNLIENLKRSELSENMKKNVSVKKKKREKQKKKKPESEQKRLEHLKTT